MRKLQKTLAVLIALLVVCGLPFSVQAVGTGEEPLAVVQALAVPNYIAQAANLPADRSVMLCFNKDVTLATANATKTKVGFGIVVGQEGNDYGTAYGNCVLGGVSGNSIRPDATMAVTTTLSTTKNNIVVTLPEGFTVSELFAKCAEKNGTGNKFRVVLRLYDSTRGIDNWIDGISYVDGENTVKLAAENNPQNIGCETNANISISKVSSGENTKTFDIYDIPIITEDDALTVKSAKWLTDTKVQVDFSKSVMVRTTNNSNDIYSGIRLVNANGQLMRYRPDSPDGIVYANTHRFINENGTTGDVLSSYEDLQAAINLTNGQSTQTYVINQTSKFAIDGFNNGSTKSLSWFNAHLEACKAEHPDEEFYVVYMVEESTGTGKLSADRCEGRNNWYISGLYATENNMPIPLIATKKSEDRAYVNTTAPIDVDGYNYADMATATAHAKEGSTITLLNDITTTQAVTLKEGVTLDLNGKTLTAEGITVFGKVADSTQGAGLVAVETGKLFINTRQENASNTNVLPLYDTKAMGYRLFNVAVNQKNHRVSTGKVEYGVSIVFGNGTYNEKAYELLADDANAAVTLEFNLLLNNDTKLFYEVKRDTFVEYANAVLADSARYQNKVIVLAVYGIDSLDEGMTLACTPELFANAEVGGTNATVYGGAQTYQHSVNA